MTASCGSPWIVPPLRTLRIIVARSSRLMARNTPIATPAYPAARTSCVLRSFSSSAAVVAPRASAM